MGRGRLNRLTTLIDSAAHGQVPVILDGALGTELDNRGADTTSPAWSGLAPLQSPKLLEEIHRDYIKAGADIITTCTFRTSKRAFERAGITGDKWRQAAKAAVFIAKSASGTNALVAGSVGPLEDCFEPDNAPRGPVGQKEHRALILELATSGVDVIWLETFGTLGELSSAIDAAVEIEKEHGTPFVVSATTNRNGDLISGEPISDAANMAQKQGSKAFCINCIPITHVPPALTKLEGATTLPIGVYANLGYAEPTQDWSGSAHLTPEAYAKEARSWNVSLIGGCCGSSPAHIRALIDAAR